MKKYIIIKKKKRYTLRGGALKTQGFKCDLIVYEEPEREDQCAYNIIIQAGVRVKWRVMDVPSVYIQGRNAVVERV